MSSAPEELAPPAAAASAQGWVQDRQYRWLTAFVAMATLVLPLAPPGFAYGRAARLAIDTEGVQAGNFRSVWLPLILLGATLVALRLRLLLWLLPHLNISLLLLLGWGLLSALWAPLPGFAFRQAFSIVGVTVLTLAFVSAAWYPERWGRLARCTLTVALLLSAAVALALPDIGVHSEQAAQLQGAWRGITYQKNGLGQLAAVSLLLFTHAGASRAMSAALTAAGALLAVFVLIMSKSSTSLALALLCCLLLLAILRPPLRLRGGRGALGLGLLLACGLPAYLYVLFGGGLSLELFMQPLAAIFGKDATFSGRTVLWEIVLEQIGQHPVRGLGFNSFWGLHAATALQEKTGYVAPNAHNGYLDLTNELGLIGLGLLIAFLVEHGRALAKVAAFDRSQYALHLALILYVCLANLTETGWFHPIMFTHVIAMFSSASLSRLLFEQRLRALQAAATP